MMPTHHPSDELLMAYASGSLDEPVSLVIATHLALCPRCRREVARFEEIGGILMAESAAEEFSQESLDSVLARLDEPATETATPAPAPVDNGDKLLVPRPLRDYLGAGLDSLSWKSFRGLEQTDLLPDFPGFRTRMMRIKSGAAMPTHTHEGTELTLVLAGGFSDELGHFLRGDLAEADGSIEHRPIADPGEDCLCLAVTEGSLHLTGRIGRLLNPFIRP